MKNTRDVLVEAVRIHDYDLLELMRGQSQMLQKGLSSAWSGGRV
jgi:hypothetical protein